MILYDIVAAYFILKQFAYKILLSIPRNDQEQGNIFTVCLKKKIRLTNQIFQKNIKSLTFYSAFQCCKVKTLG